MFGLFRKPYEHIDHEKSKPGHGDKMYLGLFAGVMIGVGIYWLFRTQSGKRVRQMVMESEEDWAKKARELISETEFAELFDEANDDVEVEDREVVSQPKPAPALPRRSFISTLSSPKRRFFKIKR